MPWAWREDIVGYTRSVADAAPSIYAETDLTTEDVPLDDFLGAVTAWRLWSKVDALYWLLTNSIAIARQQNLDGFSAGGARYTSGGDTEQQLRDLRRGIRETFAQSRAEYLLAATGPRDVLVRMLVIDGT